MDYEDDGSSLVTALQGQQFLVITLSTQVPPDTHGKIVQAAAKAGVPYIMPNAYGYDLENVAYRNENMHGVQAYRNSVDIRDAGAAYVAMCCGFWYQWCLSRGHLFTGFDIKNRSVVFFDDGNTPINFSSFQQCGRALAGLLSLPESGASPSILDWRNKMLFITSFRASQRDILNSLHRVMGTTDKDWTITMESSAERFKRGMDMMKNNDMPGRGIAMWARTFYPNGDGDFESTHGVANEALGLEREDFNQATKEVVQMVESGSNL